MEISSIRIMQELLRCGVDIPLWHYDADGRLLDTNSEHLVLDKILDFVGGIHYMLDYASRDQRPLILGSDMGLMWCAVFEKEKDVLRGIWLMGPVFHAEVSSSFISESAERYHIDSSFREQYRRIMSGICVVSSMMFLQYGLMLHYCVTGRKLNRSDIQFQPRSTILSPLSRSQDQLDWTRVHYTEQTLLRIIREGDLSYKQQIAEANHLFAGIMENDRETVRHAVIRATGFAALCIREAIQAGISPDTAHGVGEGYIESMAQCNSTSEVTALNLAMFEDFVFRVHKHRTNPKVSPQIQSCRDYIELHAEQELTLPDLAKQVGYSEYYLSRKFKREMGVSISTYIKYVRVERSKLMLAGTSMTIGQIAETLHFASSSHFSDGFREVTGKTPQQYRMEKQKF